MTATEKELEEERRIFEKDGNEISKLSIEILERTLGLLKDE